MYLSKFLCLLEGEFKDVSRKVFCFPFIFINTLTAELISGPNC